MQRTRKGEWVAVVGAGERSVSRSVWVRRVREGLDCWCVLFLTADCAEFADKWEEIRVSREL